MTSYEVLKSILGDDIFRTLEHIESNQPFNTLYNLDGPTDEAKLPVSRTTNKYVSILFPRTQVHGVVPSLENWCKIALQWWPENYEIGRRLLDSSCDFK